MLTAHPSTVLQKKDLHVGGLGLTARANASAPRGYVADDLNDSAQSWVDRARNAEVFIRTNPWTAVALVGLVGLAAGVALARRG
jgi:ElaB/YqjD/DUF883 family membrane-anchored ribosome-binding protein